MELQAVEFLFSPTQKTGLFGFVPVRFARHESRVTLSFISDTLTQRINS